MNSENMNIVGWQVRLNEELKEVESRMEKLNKFIATSEVYQNLTCREKSLLDLQSSIMQSYVEVLEIRKLNCDCISD